MRAFKSIVYVPTAKYSLLTDLVLSPFLRNRSAVIPPKGPERDFTKKGVAARKPICVEHSINLRQLVSNKTVELMFTGIDIYWDRLRPI